MAKLTEIDNLIISNIGLIKMVVQAFRPRDRNHFDELMQCGMIGFWKAVKRYDPSRSKFSTAAYNYIKYEVLENIRGKRNANNRYQRANEYFLENGPNITVKNTEIGTQIELDLLEEYIPPNLSKSEQKILEMLSMGYNKKEIGKRTRNDRKELNKIIAVIFEKIRVANNV